MCNTTAWVLQQNTWSMCLSGNFLSYFPAKLWLDGLAWAVRIFKPSPGCHQGPPQLGLWVKANPCTSQVTTVSITQFPASSHCPPLALAPIKVYGHWSISELLSHKIMVENNGQALNHNSQVANLCTSVKCSCRPIWDIIIQSLFMDNLQTHCSIYEN